MKVEEALERLGGVASTDELRHYVSWPRIRLAVKRGRIVKDNRGRYALPGADAALRMANALSGVLCLDSAAQQHGWKLKRRPSSPAVAVPRKRTVASERRAGVRLLYVDLPAADVVGRVTSYLRTVMDCAARLPFDESLVIADSALRAGDVTKAQLLAAAEQIRVQPQVWVGDLGRADLGDSRLHLAVEAESFEFHGVRRLLKRDCERYNGFVLHGWVVVRFAWEHVMFEPDYVRNVLTGVVRLLSGRPPVPASRQAA